MKKKINKNIKKYGSAVNIIDNYNLNIKIFNSLLFAFGILCLCYILVLGNMIFDVIERKSVESESRALASEISDLESMYLAKASVMDLDLSEEMGFKQVKAQFATRKALGSAGVAFKNEI